MSFFMDGELSGLSEELSDISDDEEVTSVKEEEGTISLTLTQSAPLSSPKEPISHSSPRISTPTPRETLPSPKETISHPSPRESTSISPKKEQESVPNDSDRSNETQLEQVRVVSDYSSQRPDELTISVGDVINVLKKMEDSWWEGKLNGKIGFFPSTFTVPLEEEIGEVFEEEGVEVSEEEDSDEDIEESDSGEESSDEEESDDDEDDEYDDEDDEEDELEDQVEDESIEELEEIKDEPLKEKRLASPIVTSIVEKRIPTPVTVERKVSAKSTNKISSPSKHRSLSATETSPRKWGRKTNAAKSLGRINPPKTEPSLKTRKTRVDKQLSILQGGDIRKYRDSLVAKDREIEELRKEIKVLNQMQKRQSRAIKDLDHEKGDLPRVLQQMSEELRMYKDRMREYQSKYHTEEKTLQTQHEEILRLKVKIAEMTKVMKAKNLDPSTMAQRLKKEMSKKDKTISNLEQKTAILTRLKTQEERKYRIQLKESNQEVERLKAELGKYKEVLQENGLNRVVRHNEEQKKHSTSPSRRLRAVAKNATPVKSPPQANKTQEKKNATDTNESLSKILPPGFSQPKDAKEEPKRETDENNQRNETVESNNLEQKEEAPLPWKKNKEANLTNPFGKLNSQSPEVATQLTPRPLTQLTPRPPSGTKAETDTQGFSSRQISFPKSNSQTFLQAPSQPLVQPSLLQTSATSTSSPSPSVGASVDPSKPSWLQGAPMTRAQGDIFKPKMGVDFGRRKDRWKLDS